MSRLQDCPSSPNCVSTLATRDDHKMAPLAYGKSDKDVLETIKKIVASEKRTKLVETKESYLHFEFKTALLGFVDDVEFELDPAKKLVHFRSASRVGYSDLGANRKRMEDLVIKLRPQI